MQCVAHNTSTHYQLIGNNPIVLVMLHGWGHTHETFANLIPGLADHFSVLLPDLPGFGESANPTPSAAGKAWNSNEYTLWLEDLIQQIIPNRPYLLLGHSFGGKIAVIATTKNTELQQGLILIDSAGLPLPLTRKEQLVQTISKLIPRKIKDVYKHQLTPEILRKVGVATDYQNANSAQQAILREIVRENIEPQLKRITLPTTIIWGEQDTTTPLSAGKQFATLIANSKLCIITAAGHCPFHDQPRETLTAILEASI